MLLAAAIAPAAAQARSRRSAQHLVAFVNLSLLDATLCSQHRQAPQPLSRAEPQPLAQT